MVWQYSFRKRRLLVTNPVATENLVAETLKVKCETL